MSKTASSFRWSRLGLWMAMAATLLLEIPIILIIFGVWDFDVIPRWSHLAPPFVALLLAWVGPKPRKLLPTEEVVEDWGTTFGHNWLVFQDRKGRFWCSKEEMETQSQLLAEWPVETLIDGFRIELPSPTPGRLTRQAVLQMLMIGSILLIGVSFLLNMFIGAPLLNAVAAGTLVYGPTVLFLALTQRVPGVGSRNGA